MSPFAPDTWAIILGGSSGFGLATARKLSRHGMNLCIVHRDRKGSMERIDAEFEMIRKSGVQVLAVNTNALAKERIQDVVSRLKAAMGAKGSVRVLLHSIAYGNLKCLVQEHAGHKERHRKLIKKLGQELGLEASKLQSSIDKLFKEGQPELVSVSTPTPYNDKDFLGDEDFELTIFSMGSSLATWVREVHACGLFAGDARILGLTSEGNEVAWRGYAAVSAAKVVLESVARAIAMEYAPYGLRANIIQAGVTDTPALRLIPGNDHLKAKAILRNPSGRLTTPDDVADFIYLMCLDEAGWASGNVIRVDGGEHISGS